MRVPTPKHPAETEFNEAVQRAAQAYIALLPKMKQFTETYVAAFAQFALAAQKCRAEIESARASGIIQ